MMQTVVNLMRTMKAFGYDVEEELFKDHHKKYKHKIKGYRSLDDVDLDDLINMLELSEERFGNLSALIDLNVTAESRSDMFSEYFSPGDESDLEMDSVIDKVLFEVGVPVNETVSVQTGAKNDSKSDSGDESDRRRRSADEEEDSAGETTSLIAAKLLRYGSDIVLSLH